MKNMKSTKRKIKWNAKKCFTNLWVLISILFLIWCAGSYIEILSKNINPNPTYSKYNIIVNFTNWANENLNVN